MSDNTPDLGLVVFVDDDKVMTRTVGRDLRRLFEREKLPYHVVTSQSPQQLLEELKSKDKDALAVVISDIMMAPMDGLQFLKEVKERYPDTLLIVLTGFTDPDTFNALREEVELFSYQEKPWRDDQFRRTIKTALDSYRRKKLLNRYVPKEIVEDVLRRRDNEILAGEELEITIMFFDFRDSTRFFHSESMTGQEALEHLNKYFEKLLAVLDSYDNGILDKFMGDGLMALFGLPSSLSRSTKQDACDAVLAALEMRDEMQKLNKQETEDWKEITIGVGISTGLVVAGNIGTLERANYTVLGNDVNIASRLEKIAPEDDGILISENTYEYVKDVVEVRVCDEPLPPKGTRGSVRVYEVLGKK